MLCGSRAGGTAVMGGEMKLGDGNRGHDFASRRFDVRRNILGKPVRGRKENLEETGDEYHGRIK